MELKCLGQYTIRNLDAGSSDVPHLCGPEIEEKERNQYGVLRTTPQVRQFSTSGHLDQYRTYSLFGSLPSLIPSESVDGGAPGNLRSLMCLLSLE